MIIVPFSELIIVFSFLMTILVALQLDFMLINVIYDTSIQILLKLIHWFADADLLFFSEIPMNLAEVLLLFVVVYRLRPFLLKMNMKNSMGLMAVILIFFMVRTGFYFLENQKDEVLVHHFNKTKVLSVKHGSRACFWIREDGDKEKLITFIVSPYCSSRRIQSMEIKTFPRKVEKVVCNGQIYDLK